MRVVWWIKRAETTDAETELIVAEVDERRPVRRKSASHAPDVVDKTDAYLTLVEQLEQLPLDGEILSTPVQGQQ